MGGGVSLGELESGIEFQPYFSLCESEFRNIGSLMTFQERCLGFPNHPYSQQSMIMASHGDPMKTCQNFGLKRGRAEMKILAP